MSDLQRLMLAAAVLLVAVLVYLLHPILTPFLVGALLAYMGDPLADRLERLHLNRTVAVCVVFAVFSIVVATVLLITLPMIGRQLDILITRIPEWLHGLQELLLPFLQRTFNLPAGGWGFEELRENIGGDLKGAGNIVAVIWQRVAGSSVVIIAMVANILLIPVVTFYLLRDWDLLIAKLRESLPRTWETKVVDVSSECHEILGAFVRGQLMVMLALSIIYSIGLGIVGLDLALLLGLLAGLASIVPYLGFIVGIVAASVAAYFQFNEWLPLLWVALVFGVGQVLESVLLTPLLVGDRIGLHPVAVIFAVMAGGQLAGFVGVLLALPVAAVIMVWLRHLHAHYKSSELYDVAKP
ncbi:AI-2E family transporter [Dasania sp. GY-MA-18]|uniref:AI-2E family transporter n=1 Tax=Dasania phycosphaerae TaxID=2950436 RepID=A0A9J6RQL5_9GAMM|nr:MULTISPECIES: AI-2E family transporter [Dasania]MCR8924077.1 AI-2E family transporter [Dasania sp. GY-MA-18]MCZ0866650.1 AI-2E family transporter [Dasania phycosphaerae]MCZ0870235.1 AI-2E family transporter [Dasania phycosphaerae]